jgi:hypothetical protein
VTSAGFQRRRALTAGTAASVASTLVLAWRSRRETGNAWGGINAISHWIFGRRSYAVDGPSAVHSSLGLLIHQASSLFWGALYDAVLGNVRGRRQAEALFAERTGPTATDAIAAAAIVSALAAFTDFRLTPPRLTPGFEHRLSRGSVALVYLAFGCGLAAAGVALAKRSVDSRRVD